MVDGIVGVSAFLLAGLGLLWNALVFVGLPAFLREMARRDPSFRREAPWTREACLVLLAASTSFHLAQLRIAAAALGGAPDLPTIAGWSAALALYFVAIRVVATLAPRPLGRSIAAATGISNVGLGLAFCTGWPVWAPLLLALAR